MIKFEIEEITNGFIVHGDMGFHTDANDEYLEDFKIFAHTLPDAFAVIANRCDQLSDEEAKRPHEAEEDQDSFPF